MGIKLKDTRKVATVPFSEIAAGECFDRDGEIMLAMDGSRGEVNAVGLETGETIEIAEDEPVERVDVTISVRAAKPARKPRAPKAA